MATHQKARGEEASAAKSKTKAAKALKDMERMEALGYMEDLLSLPITVTKAKVDNVHFARWKNDDGTLGGFTALSVFGKHVHLDPRCVVNSSNLMGDNAVGAGTIISTSSIGRGTKIGKRSRVYSIVAEDNAAIGDHCFLLTKPGMVGGGDTMINDDVRIGDYVQISNAYLGDRVRIGNEVRVQGLQGIDIMMDSVVGEKARVRDGARIFPGSSVPEGSEVLPGTSLDNEKMDKESVRHAIHDLSKRS